ncbi:MAG: alpha/beta hydrolase [Alphaproteobacteria bacterium]|nr:alpha/beta hydrolase [Alphaproteobacteria bacterium]
MLRSETAGDTSALARALSGLRRYQEAERSSPPPPPAVVAELGGATLRGYGGSGVPLVFIPSLINPPNILDLSREKSLLRWLADQGHRPLLLDWGWPGESRKALDIAGHVERLLLPLLDGLDAPPVLAGYCLGGTMAIAAAALRPVEGLVLIAAPWHFGGFPDESRAALARLWAQARPTAESLGMLPMEALQSAFWNLDPARTVAKFTAFADMEPGSAEARSFVLLEDWANDGPPLTEAAARELFEGFFGDDTPGRGAWRVAGRAVDPAALACPILDIVSRSDRIVPAASAAAIGERLDLAQGHVGMIVGSSARQALWHPLSDWLFGLRPSC